MNGKKIAQVAGIVIGGLAAATYQSVIQTTGGKLGEAIVGKTENIVKGKGGKDVKRRK